jgi:hypothetical protein
MSALNSNSSKTLRRRLENPPVFLETNLPKSENRPMTARVELLFYQRATYEVVVFVVAIFQYMSMPMQITVCCYEESEK